MGAHSRMRWQKRWMTLSIVELERGIICLITTLASLILKHWIWGMAPQQYLKYPKKGRERSLGLLEAWRKFLLLERLKELRVLQKWETTVKIHS